MTSSQGTSLLLACVCVCILGPLCVCVCVRARSFLLSLGREFSFSSKINESVIVTTCLQATTRVHTVIEGLIHGCLALSS